MNIGFIGAGQMAQALAAGFLRAELATADAITASDPSPAAAEAFCRATGGAKVVASNVEVARAADVLFLAVKPQHIEAALAEIRGRLRPQALVVSIAAGVRLATLAAGLPSVARLVRVMPNTPCLVGRSASGYSMGLGTTADDNQQIERLLSAVGVAYKVDERLLDAVTGLAGSGPAFVYTVIEALSDGGVRMGLPRDVSLALAAHTVRGAAEMVIREGEHPAVLKDRVTSPGGTTIAGLQALENGSLRGVLMAAVEAATQRARELGDAK